MTRFFKYSPFYLPNLPVFCLFHPLLFTLFFFKLNLNILTERTVESCWEQNSSSVLIHSLKTTTDQMTWKQNLSMWWRHKSLILQKQWTLVKWIIPLGCVIIRYKLYQHYFEMFGLSGCQRLETQSHKYHVYFVTCDIFMQRFLCFVLELQPSDEEQKRWQSTLLLLVFIAKSFSYKTCLQC